MLPRLSHSSFLLRPPVITSFFRFSSSSPSQSSSSSSPSSSSSSSSPSSQYDVGIVGGGIVGVATARELLMRHPNLQVAIFEKESSIGMHQSSHNSGVIHSGLYYAPGSKRAALCVKGNAQMYEYLTKKEIPHSKCGKLIVAARDAELPRLESLLARGVQNGVPGLRIVEREEIKQIEPFCEGVRAIHVPTAGIVDYLLVVQSMADDVKKLGGNIFVNFEAAEFEETNNSIIVKPHVKANQAPKKVRHLITCAGLYSDRVAKQLSGKENPSIVPFRGDFLRLKNEHTHMVKSLIYPVPNPEFPFLGVHFTRRMNGEVWLGPNAVLGFAREGYHWSTINFKDLLEAAKNSGLRKLVKKHWKYGMEELYKDLVPSSYMKNVHPYMPHLSLSHIDFSSPSPSGVRAQALNPDGKLVEDFVYDMPEGGKVLHVRNAPSPACTSSLAIAQEIVETAQKHFRL